MTQTLKQLLQGATIVAAPNPLPTQIAAQTAQFSLIPELESLDIDTLGAIDSADTLCGSRRQHQNQGTPLCL
jgi:hypothetical protein